MISTKNLVRRGFYADSVALMRIARELGAAPGVLRASLMIGTASNKALFADSGLLAEEGRAARADDLVIAVKAKSAAQAEAALVFAENLLLSGTGEKPGAEEFPVVAGLRAAMEALQGANLALISVPGEFAALEARRALEHGLHVMVFSDNVPLEEEVALKALAAKRGLLLMGPDCGTALLAGTPIAFANAVPRGDTGIVSASGTGLQEVSCLLARAGRGVSHGIGVGGRDLSREVAGRMTLAAIDALDADAATRRIIVISKPPAPSVSAAVVARAARSRKPVVLCLLGAKKMKLPSNVTLVRTLEEAAGKKSHARGKITISRKGGIRGLFCGGTLCAEAQIVLMDHGLKVSSNVPVPGASASGGAHRLIDLGDDAFTRGRPHPMIDPALRDEHLRRALRDKGVGVVLLDVVIGYGAHHDPAGLLVDVLKKKKNSMLVIASVTGTESDPQVYSKQVASLRAAGAIVAASNAAAARIAAQAAGGCIPARISAAATRRGMPSPARRPRQSRPHSRSR